MTEQGYQPRRAGRDGRPVLSRTPRGTRGGRWQELDASEAEADVPPWAGLHRPAHAARPSGDAGRGPGGDPGAGGRARRGRAVATRQRRIRRRWLTAAVAAAAAAAVTGAWFIAGGQPSARSGPVTITTLQPGEYRAVPDACRVLSAAALRQYVGGPPRRVQTFDYSDQSQCGYTYDAKPTFRVLDVTIQAYQPFLGVPGNGSATANARYAFAQKRQALARPPRRAPQPPARLAAVGGLGTAAFSATQVIRAGAVTDRVTVMVLYRNVLITASLEALASDGFGPVPAGVLQAGALGAARRLLAAVRSAPAVGG